MLRAKNSLILVLTVHGVNEVTVVDLVTLLGHGKELLELSRGDGVSEVGEGLSELLGVDNSGTRPVELLEGVNEVLRGISLSHLAGHESREAHEVNAALTSGVGLLQHLLGVGLLDTELGESLGEVFSVETLLVAREELEGR